MSKTVVIVGAMDTKGEDFAYVKKLIEQHGVQTLVVDFGVMGEPGVPADVSAAEVAAAGGGNLADFRSGDRKDQAMSTMARGVAAVVRELYDDGKLDGIFGMGGSGGTSVTTTAMRELPVGVPKVMVSTVAGGDVSAYAGTKDITFIPSIVDVAGLNRISRQIYANAAGAITGMVNTEVPAQETEDRPLVTASMFGNTTEAVNRAKGIIEDNGYEVLVFHATGTGGRVMESLIMDGFITGSLDITTTELADEVCGGVFSAGPERVQAASKAGVPAVIVPGCVDMANFGGKATMPEKYHERNLYEWNPNVTLMRTNVEENKRMGEMIAAAANMAEAPVAVVLPMKGVSMLDSDGQMFWDPEADATCYNAIRTNLKDGIPVHEVDHNINDPEFADYCANLMLEMLKSS